MPESIKTIGVIGMGSIGRRHEANLADLGCATIPFDPILFHNSKDKDQLGRVLDVCDAFVISSPTDTHFEYLDRCAQYDKPIFVEKPIVNTRSQLNGLRSLPTIMGDTFVGYNLRFHACVKQAKAWLDEGKLGPFLWAQFICAQYNDRPGYLRDGVILNWSHEIDLALHLLGPAVVTGSSVRRAPSTGADNMADILLTHIGDLRVEGCRTTIHLDYLTKPEQRGFVIKGTKGQIICDLPSRIVALDMGDSLIPEIDRRVFNNSSYDSDYVDEMKAFLDHIDGKPHSGATGTEALDVLEICLRARSYKT